MSYKSHTKNTSRRLLLEKAVECLTRGRKRLRVLSENNIRRLWDYCFEEVLLKHKLLSECDENYIDSWIETADFIYSNKKPSELRVGYLCGPEPENDLQVLLESGVRIENIWAFENDNDIYRNALKNAKRHFLNFKIFPGTIQSFLQINPISFDIIYLDFTGPLISANSKPFKAIHDVFDCQALNEISVLLINSCVPDHTTDAVDFLYCYFLNQPFVEGTIYGKKNDEGIIPDWFVEGPSVYGYYDEKFKKIINKNFEAAYSAFASQYPILYASTVQPAHRVIANQASRKRFFSNTDDIMGAIKKISNFTYNESDVEIGSLISDAHDYPLWHFIELLKQHKNNICNSWTTEFNQNINGYSRFDAIQYNSLLRSFQEGYAEIISKDLLNAIPSILNSIPDRNGGLFCDVPQVHLWLELALNQLGFPYHANIQEHKRFKYKAKTRTMVSDLFVMDRCRSLYDWLPFFEFYEEELSIIEKQIIARSCIASIGSQRRWVDSTLYFGSALIGMYEKSWNVFPSFPSRIDLNSLGKLDGLAP